MHVNVEQPLRLYCDNNAAISMTQNNVHHDQIRHVEIDEHFTNEKITISQICITLVPSKGQLADILIKGVNDAIFKSVLCKLVVVNIYVPA